MTTSAKYPAKAARALGYLKAHSNDIEIYVEDSGTPNVWLKLLRNHLPRRIRLTSVTVLGSKEGVIQACKADQASDGRRKLYIVDGDLDVICGRSKPRLKHLYRLRSYCVENYLLDEESFISAVMVLDPRVEEISARRTIDFVGWFERNRLMLSCLFVCYAVTYELMREQETVGYSVYKLLESTEDSFDLSERKVVARVAGLYRKLRSEYSIAETRDVFDRIKERASKVSIECFVSGKDYIFPPLYSIIKSNFKTSIRADSFRVLVAECMASVADPYLSRRLRRVCQ